MNLDALKDWLRNELANASTQQERDLLWAKYKFATMGEKNTEIENLTP